MKLYRSGRGTASRLNEYTTSGLSSNGFKDSGDDSRGIRNQWEMWWKQKEENEAALKDSITKGDYDAVKKLLAKTYAKPSVNCLFADSFTPLHFACLAGNHKIIALLVKNNANVNAQNRLKRTPLHYACQIEEDLFSSARGSKSEPENLKSVKLLLEHGANPNIKDTNKRYPYQHARDKTIEALLKSKISEEPDSGDVRASKRGQDELIKEIRAQREIDKEVQRKIEENKAKLELANNIQKQKEELNKRLEQAHQTKSTEKTEYKPPEPLPKVSSPISYGKHKLRPASFEIMQPLGAGAFGQVWLVKNKNNSEVMAMKVIDKARLIQDDLMPYANTEKNIMLQIQHPFIIGLKHSFQTPEKYFLLMEYCSGGDLAGIIQKKGKLEEEEAKYYIAEILLAIETLHNYNIAYRYV